MKKYLFTAALLVTSLNVINAANSFISKASYGYVIAADEDDEDSVNKMLISYEKYVNQYISALKKAKEGDPKAIIEYAKLLKKAQDLQNKLEDVKDDMTATQIKKLNNLNNKLLKAASEM